MPVWKKLNLKEQNPVFVLNAPDSFEVEIAELSDDYDVRRTLGRSRNVDFVIAFATKQNEIDKFAEKIVSRSEGDTVVWIAYPKKTSKRHNCEFDRDTGWESIGHAGFEGVRQVAIDEDWSALRFRRVEFIKQMTRDPKRAVSKTGKARTKRK